MSRMTAEEAQEEVERFMIRLAELESKNRYQKSDIDELKLRLSSLVDRGIFEAISHKVQLSLFEQAIKEGEERRKAREGKKR